jgi:hypothetical protein
MANTKPQLLAKYLKPLAEEDSFASGTCAFKDCVRRSDLIDGTHRYFKGDVPLCDKHWEKLDDLCLKKIS